MGKHTQGQLKTGDGGYAPMITNEASTKVVAVCNYPTNQNFNPDISEREANAAEIVLRWNLHEELVEALRKIGAQAWTNPSEAVECIEFSRLSARAILAKVDQ